MGNRDDQRIVASSFHALVDGNRPSVAELSRRTGIRQRSVERSVRRLVASGRVSMAEGKVVAAAGLSLVPTSHQLRLGRRWFYAWCAWDLLGIPAGLGRSSLVRTPCAMCGRELEVPIRNGWPPRGRPERGWLPDLQRLDDNPRRDFCPLANMFCTVDHLESWALKNVGDDPAAGRPCDLNELAAVGHPRWRELVA